MNIGLDCLCKKFGELTVLENFSAQFPQGTVTCIMGDSGRGKTTLLHLLIGLIQPDSGRLYGVKEQRFSMVFQENRLCEQFTALSNIRMLDGIDPRQAADHLGEVGLADHLEQRVCSLSGGMKRRVAIVRAMIAPSDVVIMDEPFKGLDEANKLRVIAYILRHRRNRTLIISTHTEEDVSLLGAILLKM